jgi:hypothetical protein
MVLAGVEGKKVFLWQVQDVLERGEVNEAGVTVDVQLPHDV